MNVIDGFERKWDFPGVIDGTHVPIVAPQENHTDYFNCKWWYFIVMQAVIHNNCFRDVYIGWPGSVHDATIILRDSELFKQATTGTLFPN